MATGSFSIPEMQSICNCVEELEAAKCDESVPPPPPTPSPTKRFKPGFDADSESSGESDVEISETEDNERSEAEDDGDDYARPISTTPKVSRSKSSTPKHARRIHDGKKDEQAEPAVDSDSDHFDPVPEDQDSGYNANGDIIPTLPRMIIKSTGKLHYGMFIYEIFWL